MSEAPGSIRIAPEVLATIVNLTAMSVPGVIAMAHVPRNRLLTRQEPDATLTLVGDGPDREYYERVAQSLGAGDRVIFTGEVPWTKMADFYRYADVFLHASLSETYGNVLGEALWCGTPTVAFADGMGSDLWVLSLRVLSDGWGGGEIRRAASVVRARSRSRSPCW